MSPEEIDPPDSARTADTPFAPPSELGEMGLLERALHSDGMSVRFGRFLLRRELGRGGFGIVYLADDLHLQRPVALKVPRPDALVNADLRQRFLREARAAARLNHPNVVPVYEAGEIGKVCYMVSAYCRGDNLAAWLRRHPGPLPPRTAAFLVAMLADAVEHAHRQGILHRDIKPSNILLDPQPAPPSELPADAPDFIPRLTDFGLAKLLEADDEQTTSGIVLGTPVYMAPEQAEGWVHAVGAPTDVYALGVILYELLTGQLPYRGPTLLATLERVREGQSLSPRHWRPDLPHGLETVCLKCLQKEPAQRYTTAQALADDLRRFLRQEPILGRLPGRVRRLGNWCRAPERIRDATVIGCFNGCISTITSLIGTFLLLGSIFPVERRGPALTYLFAGVATGCAVLWIAWHTPARRQRVLWAGALVPWPFPLYMLAGWSHRVDIGGILNEQDRSMALAQVTTILFVNGVTILTYALALGAYYANRHRPGFVPEDMDPTRLG